MATEDWWPEGSRPVGTQPVFRMWFGMDGSRFRDRHSWHQRAAASEVRRREISQKVLGSTRNWRMSVRFAPSSADRLRRSLRKIWERADVSWPLSSVIRMRLSTWRN